MPVVVPVHRLPTPASETAKGRICMYLLVFVRRTCKYCCRCTCSMFTMLAVNGCTLVPLIHAINCALLCSCSCSLVRACATCKLASCRSDTIRSWQTTGLHWGAGTELCRMGARCVLWSARAELCRMGARCLHWSASHIRIWQCKVALTACFRWGWCFYTTACQLWCN